MKSMGLFFSLLWLQLQVSASFLSDFRGAMANVERGFGKLITDIVADVKDTFHSSLSAVEQVLSNELVQHPSHRLDYQISPRHIHVEFEKPIPNDDNKVDDILGYRQVNNELKQVTETLKDERNRLEEIADILKRELENMSRNVRFETRNLNFHNEDYSVDSIWDKIKTLQNIQENSNNSAEVSNIRQILDKVMNKLHLKVSDKYDLVSDEVKKKLQKYSNINDKRMEISKQPTLLKIEEQTINERKTENTPKTFKNVVQILLKQDKVPNDSSKTQKSLFESDLTALDYLTPFTKTNNKEAVNDAKKIFTDSRHTAQVLNRFFYEHRNGPDVFNNQELFNFG